MSHVNWEDRMIEVLDGRADRGRSAELDEHLAGCRECRASFEGYSTLFADLRAEARAGATRTSPGGGTMEADWSHDGRSGAPGAPAPALAQTGPAAPARGGWRGVAAGLAAAGGAMVLLAGLYLTTPRTGGAPQAFTNAGGERVGGTEGGDGDLARRILDHTAAAEAAAGAPLVDRALVETSDPLTDLAEIESTLESLTPAEAEELVRELEAET